MDQGKATGSPAAEIVTPASHTPLPWSVGDHRRSIVRDVPGLADGYEHYNIAVLSSHSLLGLEEAYANAELIASAVNSHAALVASLQEMMGIYWGDGDGELPEPGCIIRARKALSEAGVTVQSSVNGSGEVNQ